MADRSDERKQLRCSFCNKTQDQVRKLIAGPGAYICDECVEICSEIIEEELVDAGLDSDGDINLLKPKEIKEFLQCLYQCQLQICQLGNISIEFGFKGESISTLTACSSATHAIGEAYKTIIREYLRRRILRLNYRRVISSWLAQRDQVRHILPRPLQNC